MGGGENTEDIITILKTILRAEYTDIANFIRWQCDITDHDIVEKFSRLARDSMSHFETSLMLIRQLGGKPSWGLEFELNKGESDLRQALDNQLNKEKLAQMGYQRAAELVSLKGMRKVLLHNASIEEKHRQLIEEILAKLAASEDDTTA